MSAVQSVQRAFSVLRSLSVGPAGVSEIAERTELPKSTVARLLSTLVDIGAVEQSDSASTYGLGETLVELSAAAAPGRNIVSISRPHLQDLVDLLEEDAGVGVLDGRGVYYLDQVNAGQEVQLRDWTGETVDAHVVSSGLVLMAFSSDEEQAAMLAEPFSPWCERSITDPVAIIRRLESVRRDGFAWTMEEMAEGINSVAAPVFDPTGSVIGAIHVHGPAYRFPDPDRRDAITRAVVRTAARVSKRVAGSLEP